MGSIANEKPHAVLVPFPAQGHINPMFKLAKLLHSKGFHITFVNTEYNHGRLVRSKGPDSVRGTADFRFETLPDGLPPSDIDGTQDILSLCDSTSKNCLDPFRDLIAKLNGGSAPPVTCIVSDGIMSFTLDVADELGIPAVLFWTTSACGFMAYLHYRHLISRGLVPLKDMTDMTNGYLDTPIEDIPGMTKMRLRDIPTFIRTTDLKDIMIRFVLRETSRASNATAIILNTFDELEGQVLNEMAHILPPIYAIGPLSLLDQQLLPSKSLLTSMSSSLWKEETSCINWLQGKETRSVVYVNFGSITVMTNEQMIEFAWGLERSKCHFLWVIRPDLVKGEHSILPQEFLDVTSGRGLIISWCNQEKVLAHPSIAGFLTHGGWNSTLESICAGVPMICWPFFAEQQTNCRYVCAEWEIGMEINNNVTREEVKGLIGELMGGEKGEEIRRRALDLKERAEKAAGKGGPASLNLERMIHAVLLSSPQKRSETQQYN